MSEIIIVLIILISGMLLSIISNRLNITGAVTGAIAGFILYYGVGILGLLLMTGFFLLGTLATSWKSTYKIRAGLAQRNEKKRTAGQVLANSGIAAILAILAIIFPTQKDVFTFMLAASFASTTGDTLSSELGNVYGNKFYNIINLQKDQRGLDGVISMEGLLFGLLGSILIAVIYSFWQGWKVDFFYIVIAGLLGNLVDSILGAALERKLLLGNNTVNFLNTAMAAIYAFLLLAVFK